MLSGWAEERWFMKSEDARCLAQKPSRMSVVRRKAAQCDRSKLVSGGMGAGGRMEAQALAFAHWLYSDIKNTSGGLWVLRAMGTHEAVLGPQ